MKLFMLAVAVAVAVLSVERTAVLVVFCVSLPRSRMKLADGVVDIASLSCVSVGLVSVVTWRFGSYVAGTRQEVS